MDFIYAEFSCADGLEDLETVRCSGFFEEGEADFLINEHRGRSFEVVFWIKIDIIIMKVGGINIFGGLMRGKKGKIRKLKKDWGKGKLP